MSASTGAHAYSTRCVKTPLSPRNGLGYGVQGLRVFDKVWQVAPRSNEIVDDVLNATFPDLISK
jgi:hypothetical protein